MKSDGSAGADAGAGAGADRRIASRHDTRTQLDGHKRQVCGYVPTAM